MHVFYSHSLGYLERSQIAGKIRLILGKLFSHSVVSDSLHPHGLQHTRVPCPSPSPGVCSNSCPLSWWYHPTISSSVIPFSSCLQPLPASGSFLMSTLFTSSGQRIGISASASVLPMNISVNVRVDFLLDWLVWSPCSPRDVYGKLYMSPVGKNTVLWSWDERPTQCSCTFQDRLWPEVDWCAH